MKIAIEGTAEQIRDGCLRVARAIEQGQDIPPDYLMQKRAKNIAVKRANKDRAGRIAADRKIIHSAFLLARKHGDPRMRHLLDALTGKADLASTVPMAQLVLSDNAESGREENH